VGTGKEPTRAAKSGIQGVLMTLIESSTSPLRVSEVLEDVLDPNVYFRFNPEDPAFECNLDEIRPQKLEAMQKATREYIEKHKEDFEKLSSVLKNSNV